MCIRDSGWGARLATESEITILKEATVSTCIGAMTVEGCYAVELENFLECFWQSMIRKGLNNSGSPATPSTVIRCDGSSLSAILAPEISLEPLGGELFQISPITNLPTHFALAGDGHYIGIDNASAIIGSTYHRHGQPLETPPWDHLKNRLEHWLPKVDGSPMRSWYGERLIVPDDRKPIVGQLPAAKGTFICTGFASKGLYWGPFAAQALTRCILHQETIPDSISLRRFN